MNYQFNFEHFISNEIYDAGRIASNKKNYLLDQNVYSVVADKKYLYLEKEQIPLGMGVITFCEVDFLEDVENIVNEMDFERLDFGTLYPRNPEELAWYSQMMLDRNKEVLKRIIERHTYVQHFAPMLLAHFKQSTQSYIGELFFIQKQFCELFESVFAKKGENDIYFVQKADERFRKYLRANPEFMPPKIAISVDYNSNSAQKKEPLMQKGSFQMPFVYECSTLSEMLFLEVYLMLQNGYMVKQCKLCGKWFSFKGKDTTDYCKRVQRGTLTCQNIHANEVHKKKVMASEAYKLYQKYYHRYKERLNVGRIKEPAFIKWQYEATAQRIQCEEGEITLQQFDDWMFESFPNSEKKRGERLLG